MTDAAGPREAREPSGVRQELTYFAHLLALTGLAIAQPLLDVFGSSPGEFLFRQAGSEEIVLFGLVVVFVPPLVLWCVAAPWRLAGVRPRLAAHLVELFLLGGLLVLALLAEFTSLPAAAAALVGAAGGAGLVVLYRRFDSVRSWLAYLAVAPVVFLGMFLFSSPTGDLFLDGEVDLAAAATTTRGAELPPVVYLVLDELPLGSVVGADGKIDAELFPNLAALAADGAWFGNTTAVASATWYAAPPLLTGNFPEQDEKPVASDQPDNLFTALRDLYDIRAREALTKLCPPGNCGGVGAVVDGDEAPGGTAAGGLGWLLRDALDVYDTVISPDATDVDATTTLAEVRGEVEVEGEVDHDPAGAATLESIPEEDADGLFDVFEESQPIRYTEFVDGLGRDTGGAPALDYLQILIPHERWVTLPSGVQYPVPEHDAGRLEGDWADVPPAIDVVRQRHLLQTAYADRLVGGVVDRLKDLGTYEDTVIVVASDHGVAFEPGESVRAVDIGVDPEPILPELMWVPLLIKAPQFEPGTVRSDNALTVDIAPTIADLIGVELSWQPDGASLVDGPARVTTSKPFYRAEISDFGFFLEPPVEVHESRRDEVLAGSVGVAYPSGPSDRLFRLGDYAQLVGRSVERVGYARSDALVVEIDEVADLMEVDLGSDVPALVNGHVQGSASGEREPVHVAVAVNGTIAFVATSFPWEDEDAAFTGVVPERLFRAGTNTIDVFFVSGPPEAPSLVQTVVAGT